MEGQEGAVVRVSEDSGVRLSLGSGLGVSGQMHGEGEGGIVRATVRSWLVVHRFPVLSLSLR